MKAQYRKAYRVPQAGVRCALRVYREDTRMKKSGIGYVLLTALAFATLEPVSKLLAGQANALALTMIRFFISSLILIPFALASIRRNRYRLSRRDLAGFAVQGVLCVCVSMVFLQMAVFQADSPAVIAVIFSTNSVITVVFAALILKERITPMKLGALALCLAGVSLSGNAGGGENAAAILLALLSAVAMRLFTVLGKKLMRGLTPEVQTGFSFLLGSVSLGAVLMLAGVDLFRGMAGGNAWIVLYLGVVVTGIGYWSYFKAIERAGTFMASFVFFIKPILAPLASLAVLGTASADAMFYVSILLVAAGSALMLIERKRAAQ